MSIHSEFPLHTLPNGRAFFPFDTSHKTVTPGLNSICFSLMFLGHFPFKWRMASLHVFWSLASARWSTISRATCCNAAICSPAPTSKPSECEVLYDSPKGTLFGLDRQSAMQLLLPATYLMSFVTCYTSCM